MNRPPSIDRILTASFDLSRIIRHMMHCIAEEGTPVNFLQIHALMVVSMKEGMTMKELADFLRVASPSATSFVTRLEKLGWVERFRDPVNRKLVRLRLTTTGKSVLREKSGMRTALIRQILASLSAKEQEDLAKILDKLHDACSKVT